MQSETHRLLDSRICPALANSLGAFLQRDPSYNGNFGSRNFLIEADVTFLFSEGFALAMDLLLSAFQAMRLSAFL